MGQKIEKVEVILSEDELAVLDGWRKANEYTSIEDAMRMLVKLGLLGEVGRAYRKLQEDR